MLYQIGMHVSGGEEIDIGRFSKSRKDSAIKRIIFAMNHTKNFKFIKAYDGY